uniref:2-amino-4-hydroxy-6- hydroxymethyldihydropteridine diphosphokinase n=1 Tax=Ningiella ruwaisensis TaxID=2364274 RepID=UPI00109F1C89|nr:2-amino-4-hydroxy-6-hydroxymethyldihydropteridine diphosphokinase [Ningiella ruwaisensis]
MTKHKILVSVGSNINKEENTRLGLDGMFEQFGALSLSRVYESESVGFSGDNFFNLVVMATTSKSIQQVCDALKHIEAECGRAREAEKFSPRTLDLDLLTFDDVVCDSPVALPRDEITYNAFVLQPMADLVPHDIHPCEQKTYQTLWEAFDKTTQKLWPVPFTWSATQV